MRRAFPLASVQESYPDTSQGVLFFSWVSSQLLKLSRNCDLKGMYSLRMICLFVCCNGWNTSKTLIEIIFYVVFEVLEPALFRLHRRPSAMWNTDNGEQLPCLLMALTTVFTELCLKDYQVLYRGGKVMCQNMWSHSLINYKSLKLSIQLLSISSKNFWAAKSYRWQKQTLSYLACSPDNDVCHICPIYI